MRIDLHGIDPWASRLPRRRDWLVAALGGLLLVGGGALLWQSAASSVAVASPDTVDATAWQTTADRSQRLNAVLADLSHPWSRWIELSLAVAGPDIRLERFDGAPDGGRLEMVVSAADLTRVGRFVDGLRALPGASSAQIVRHEASTDGLRVHVEVDLR